MAGLKNVPSEGGSGGKRGHSGMEHRAFSAEVKKAARARRRADDRKAVAEGTKDLDRPGGRLQSRRSSAHGGS